MRKKIKSFGNYFILSLNRLQIYSEISNTHRTWINGTRSRKRVHFCQAAAYRQAVALQNNLPLLKFRGLYFFNPLLWKWVIARAVCNQERYNGSDYVLTNFVQLKWKLHNRSHVILHKERNHYYHALRSRTHKNNKTKQHLHPFQNHGWANRM